MKFNLKVDVDDINILYYLESTFNYRIYDTKNEILPSHLKKYSNYRYLVIPNGEMYPCITYNEYVDLVKYAISCILDYYDISILKFGAFGEN